MIKKLLKILNLKICLIKQRKEDCNKFKKVLKKKKLNGIKMVL